MPATSAGTLRFVQAQPESRRASYRLTMHGLWLSSLGLGTYLGPADDDTDAAYQDAFARAVAMGCNVFDCAINYRFQRSERALGAWLARALADGSIRRDEVVIASKGGFVPYNGAMPVEPRKWVNEQFLANGLVHPNEFCADYQHCMSPAYLEQMIEWSRANLGVDTIDIYYLHNPETQRLTLSRDTFRARMLDAFETMESAAEQGHIGCYGMATWTAYRTRPDAPDYLSLTEMVGLAMQVAGESHRLRYVQMPYNAFMTEAFAWENQQVNEGFLSAIDAAGELGLTVMISAPLHQGRLASPLVPQLADVLTGLDTDAQRALQFVRSSPGVMTALVGTKDSDHVAEDFALLDTAPAPEDTIRGLFTSR